MRIRKAFVVYVDLDPVPSAMHTQESVQTVLGWILRKEIPHYNPVVSLAPSTLQPLSEIEVRKQS